MYIPPWAWKHGAEVDQWILKIFRKIFRKRLNVRTPRS
jgi:hypothetical protein